ncbi:peptidase inhibitor family I36 protein [Streptomyces bobili]|uniref:peptidase inhibitor family I36 protein n=1 Tax=Streptomyces bobili TaxID=67280 RepID=UPI0022593306|nr:peptidase inhibitor family I36 protein [Streptomyces bobili]MCX5527493.1 peptidase inhibitor family I36 protein [Streptomyces bobili]
MRKRLIVTLAATAAFGATLATAPTASAEASPPNCPRGYFCAYSGPNQTGSLVFRTAGNWSGTYYAVGSVFNNGLVDPGVDHVQFGYSDNSVAGSRCMHFNPGPGAYKWNAPDGAITALSVRWRGEC